MYNSDDKFWNTLGWILFWPIYLIWDLTAPIGKWLGRTYRYDPTIQMLSDLVPEVHSIPEYALEMVPTMTVLLVLSPLIISYYYWVIRLIFRPILELWFKL